MVQTLAVPLLATCLEAVTDPECTWTEKTPGEKLGVIRQRVHTWISDIRARPKVSRIIVIIRPSRPGWTQDEIGKVWGYAEVDSLKLLVMPNLAKLTICAPEAGIPLSFA